MRRLLTLVVLAVLGLSLCGAGVCWEACEDDGPDGTCGPACDDCTCCTSSRVLDFAHPPAAPMRADVGCVEVAASSPFLPPLPDDIPHVPKSLLT